jgi:trehalose synthase
MSAHTARSVAAGPRSRSPRRHLSSIWLALVAAVALANLTGCRHSSPTVAATPPASDEIDWLTERSILAAAPRLDATVEGNGAQWQQPYGLARPQAFLDLASVWFNAYPASLITPAGESFLQALGDPRLLGDLEQVGIQAIHTGPVKRAGSVRNMSYDPTIDGNFDRIELAVDPTFGSAEQYTRAVAAARQHGIAIIGDIIPGHTGMGPDFRLAERAAPGYPALYAMSEIPRDDWDLLPPLPDGADSVNLSRETAERLQQKGYILGPLDAVIFKRPGIKESNWSATPIVMGVDGRQRRWVYLHLFKAGQPTLNWLDPSFAAARLISADILHSLRVLGARGLRLDANMFLGFGPREGGGDGWLVEHPLSTVATEVLAMTIRKLGGFSFQELNASLDKIKSTLATGPELAYDFTTRPVYLYALATGDAGPLRLMLRQMLATGVGPGRMVHAMQNHDELMLEESDLHVHGDREFAYEGVHEKGEALFGQIPDRVRALTTGARGPYNESFAMSPGVCSTLTGFTAASLGVRDIDHLSTADIDRIRDRHLAAAAFNALQPGAFVISGWDLVGALPVPRQSVRGRLADNDCRWLNRGAYDLTGAAPTASASASGLPRAVALYGPLDAQLADPASFASRLRGMLAMRRRLDIAHGTLVSVPDVRHPGLVVMVIELPGATAGRQAVVAVNFGRQPVREPIDIGLPSPTVAFSSAGGTVPRPLARRQGPGVGNRLRGVAGHRRRKLRTLSCADLRICGSARSCLPAAERNPADDRLDIVPRSPAGDRAQHDERLDTACDRVRQRRVDRRKREVLFTGEEAQQRAPAAGGVIADRPLQGWIAHVDRVEDGRDRHRAGHLDDDLSVDSGQLPQVIRELDPDHHIVCTSTETTGGRSWTMAFHESPPSVDA